MKWYYVINDQQYGPVEEEEIRGLAERGELKPNDLVWNEAMGDQWSRAAAVPELADFFPAGEPPQSLTVSSGWENTGATPNVDLMAQARASLKGLWGLAVGAYALAQLINMALSFLPPPVGLIASVIVTPPLLLGVTVFFLALTRGEEPVLKLIFSGFGRTGTAIAAHVLMTIFILLWTLLLIVPGIMAGYSYAMTFYVIADDPTVGAAEAIRRSAELMRGNRWKLFCLELRFLGWALLCLLTFGIGFLWLTPYVLASRTRFYDDIAHACDAESEMVDGSEVQP